MKTTIDGNGNDSSAAVLAYLKAGHNFRFAMLYLIGDIENPLSQWLTDYESPLVWNPYGTFYPGGRTSTGVSAIRRGPISVKLGLEVTTMDLTWAPPAPTFTQSIATASPYQLARLGHYNNWNVKAWKVYMPSDSPGDCNTFGAEEAFGGRIQGRSVGRGEIKFTVNSWLDVVNQMVPVNVIELTNTLASFAGGTIPASLATTPRLNIVEGSTTTVLFAQTQAPHLNMVFANHSLQRGFLIFNPGGTLDMQWRGIQDNFSFTISSVLYNEIILYSPLPWPPTPGVDSFLLSAAAPTDGTIGGFPYVPNFSLTPPLL